MPEQQYRNQCQTFGATAFIGEYARHALRISGEYSGFYPEHLEKNKRGAPMPCNGIYWSLTHKPGCVAGVVARSPIGIDIERIKAVSSSLFEKICTREERYLFANENVNLAFFRCFTAKEAILKLTGTGLRGLNNTKIVNITDQLNLTAQYKGFFYEIEHFVADGYITSVVKNNSNILWDYIVL